MIPKLFSELGLSPEMLKAIDKLGYEQASPIQAAAIPVLMEGKDIVGQSQTGSGKTAAFAIPAVEKVDTKLRGVQILILCPTRELAVQVSEEVHKLTIFKKGIQALPIYGGQSYERQYYGLQQGAQIVIGTPGRLMDHMRRGTLRLDKLKMIILDEADVMLDMGFREDIEVILKALPPERQTVFFSATMPRPIQDLIQRFAKEPQSVKIEQKAMTVPTVEQHYYEVDRRFKIELLTRLIDVHDLKLGIVFCNTKRMVDDLVDHLNAQGYSADRLHGDMNQNQRDRVMQKFRKSGLEFLVATDVAARGIDVDDVQVVFNYDLPYDVEDYVHRIGRTGRAGRSGRAISFISGRELFQIQHIERYTKMRIQRGKVPTQDEVDQAKTSVFLTKLRATLTSGEYKKQDHLIERLLEEGFTSTDIASALIHHVQGAEGDPVTQPVEREEARGGYDRGGGRDDRRGGFREERGGFRQEQRGGYGDNRYDERPPARPPMDRPVAPRPMAARPAPIARPSIAPKPVLPKPTTIAATADAVKEAAGAVVKPVEAKPAPTPVVKTEAPVAPKPEVKPFVPKVKPPEAAATSAPVLVPSSSKVKPMMRIPEKRELIEDPVPVRSPKASRKTPDFQKRLYMNVGESMGVTAEDVIQAIQGETGFPAKVIGTVDIREKHLFVDVSAEHANSILAKLKRTQIKGHKVKAKEA
ncbi:MAG: box helicase [Verrucomicrobia bacterium]|jgi:ATP-dependent RNA helicase DeaD|nr:box helicase [Verrucomicrobiota bacterium]